MKPSIIGWLKLILEVGKDPIAAFLKIHNFPFMTRDKPASQSSGWAQRLSQELAELLGDPSK